MSPSFMSAALHRGLNVNSMRPRRRGTRAMSRQILRNRDQQRRGNIWLQPTFNLDNESHEDEQDISSDGTSSFPESDSSSSSSSSNECAFGGNPSSPLGNRRSFAGTFSSSSSNGSCCADHLGSEKGLNQRLLLLQRRNGLINITIRTMKLMRKNQQLQQRLAQLQAETRAFVRSVMNNPENQRLRISRESMLFGKQQCEQCDESSDSVTENQDECFTSESGHSIVEK